MRQIIQLTKFYPPLYPFYTFLKHYLCPVLKMVQKQLKALLEIHPQAHFLLANSGGVDSMVLFHLLLKTGCPFSVAHCNFGLRGAASDGDENFIIALCHKHQITVHTKNFATKAYANTNGVSIQMAARELRYEWFETLKNQHNFSHLLTAHHLDDQLETFMINVGRGSGLKGLRGIRSETIVRPLLPFSKSMIVDYAKANAIEWREDASNASDDYLRNQLRHLVIPQWKAANTNLLHNASETFNHLALAQEALSVVLAQFKAEYFDENKGVTKVSLKAIKALKPLDYYLFALFSSYGFTHLADLHSLLEAQSGKQLTSASHRLVRDRNHLLLTLRIADEQLAEVEWTPTENLVSPICLSISQEAILSPEHALLDASLLKYPLILRKYNEGDYFYPIGMPGKKKLSKFFKDQKYSMIEKENQWFLCSEGQIVWVIGQRVDARFAASTATENPLIIKCT